MAFQPVPNCYGVEIRCTWDGQEVENTLAFSRTGSASQAQAEALGQAILGWFVDSYLPLVASTLVLREVYVRDLEAQNFIQHTEFPIGVENGGSLSPSLPNNNTLCIAFRSAVGGRSARGRNFILGLTENQVTASTVVSTFLTDMVNAYNDIPDYVTPLNLTHVVASRYANNVKRTEGMTFVITSYGFTNAVVDSQRRRLPGRGK